MYNLFKIYNSKFVKNLFKYLGFSCTIMVITSCSNNEVNKVNNNNELMDGSGESNREPKLKKCEKKKKEKKKEKKPKKSESKEDKPRNGVNEDVAGDNAVRTLIDLIHNRGNNENIENVLEAFNFFWNIYEQEVQQHGGFFKEKDGKIILFGCSIRRFVLGKRFFIEIRDLFEAFRVFFLSNGNQMSSAQILRSFVFMLALSGQSNEFFSFSDNGVGGFYNFHVEQRELDRQKWLDKQQWLKFKDEEEWFRPFMEDCLKGNWEPVENFLANTWNSGMSAFLYVIGNPVLISICGENNDIRNGIYSILKRIIGKKLMEVPEFKLVFCPWAYDDWNRTLFYRFLNVIKLHRELAQYGFENIGLNLDEWLRSLEGNRLICLDDIDQDGIDWYQDWGDDEDVSVDLIPPFYHSSESLSDE